MKFRFRNIVWLSLALIFAWQSGQKSATADEGIDFFESNVRPLLVEHCYECHSVESGESNGELLIDSAIGVRNGGVSGPAIVPGKPDESLLMRVVSYDDKAMQMPPEGKLEPQSIAILRRWIEAGAPDPREGKAVVKEPSPIERDPKSHWSFVTPLRPVAPERVDGRDRDAMDAWVGESAAKMNAKPNPPADDETLVRRLCADLTGLPPTMEQLESYRTSTRPDRYTRLVDSLLASPEYGERFARHWLDVARYADTVGYDLGGRDRRIQGSQRYRDWAIRSFGDDMPYDQMLMHQLAGDRTDPQNAEGNLDAMGFLTLGRKFLDGLNTTDDRIDVITRGLLGLTVACARCHDHKFDPIPTTDYYSLFGILASSVQPPEGASPLMMVDTEKVGDRPVFLRGQAGNHGPIAPRQFLTSLRKDDEPRFTDGSGRYELAQRITASDNPLTSRVMVNRLWTQLIGKSLVESPSDFGFRTQPPAVPQVLDDLAVEFASHWSIKRIVRRIVLSSVYRQSAEVTATSLAIDPDNRLLARANRKRRDFESLRDSLLCVAGSMDRQMGGEPVEITHPTPTPRRTVYAMIDRQNLPALFRTFDFAGPDTHSPQRYFTTVPQQALFLMNSPQMFSLARSAAAGVRKDCDINDDDALTRGLFRSVLRRDPTEEELAGARDFLSTPSTPPPLNIDARSLWSFGIGKLGDREKVETFEPFKHFVSDRWQPAEKFPTDAPFGYAFLDRENGHTPGVPEMGVVRRFTAPIDGEISVQGQVRHSDQGDGVHIGIWIGAQRKFFGNQKGNNRSFGPLRGTVKAGDTIDIVASSGETASFDSFFLRATIRLTGNDGTVVETNSDKDFGGPSAGVSGESLDRLSQLAHVLMMSNEFAFVD